MFAFDQCLMAEQSGKEWPPSSLDFTSSRV